MPALSPSISPSAGASVTTGDAAFRSVSVSATLPAFISSCQRVGQCVSIHIAQFVAACFGLHLCKAVMQHVDQCLDLHSTNCLAKTIPSQSLLACLRARSKVPWLSLRTFCHEGSRPPTCARVSFSDWTSVFAFTLLSVSYSVSASTSGTVSARP